MLSSSVAWAEKEAEEGGEEVADTTVRRPPSFILTRSPSSSLRPRAWGSRERGEGSPTALSLPSLPTLRPGSEDATNAAANPSSRCANKRLTRSIPIPSPLSLARSPRPTTQALPTARPSRPSPRCPLSSIRLATRRSTRHPLPTTDDTCLRTVVASACRSGLHVRHIPPLPFSLPHARYRSRSIVLRFPSSIVPDLALICSRTTRLCPPSAISPGRYLPSPAKAAR